jgi:hypothetical protein
LPSFRRMIATECRYFGLSHSGRRRSGSVFGRCARDSGRDVARGPSPSKRRQALARARARARSGIRPPRTACRARNVPRQCAPRSSPRRRSRGTPRSALRRCRRGRPRRMKRSNPPVACRADPAASARSSAVSASVPISPVGPRGTVEPISTMTRRATGSAQPRVSSSTAGASAGSPRKCGWVRSRRVASRQARCPRDRRSGSAARPGTRRSAA